MVRFNCKSVPVDAFNRLAESRGMSVVSRDGRVDRRDTFEQKDDEGSQRISFRDDRVQSVMRLWRSDCVAMRRRAVLPEMKKLARAFRVKFGPPAVPATGDAERFGVYRGSKHLFDVDAYQGAGEAEPGIATQFQKRQLAHLLAAGLDVGLPARYRARVLASRTDRRRMKGMGVSFDAAREEIRGPSGELLCYGGTAAAGFTRVARIEVISDTSLKIIMHTEDGQHRQVLFPLKSREGSPAPEQELIAADPYGEDAAEPSAEVRPPNERSGKKRTIRGPGISITVYE